MIQASFSKSLSLDSVITNTICVADLSFHSYLESLLENNSEYVEVKDIISRFDTLAATNAELLDRSRIAQEKTESDRQSFAITLEVRRTGL